MTTKEQQEFEKKVLDQFMSGKSLFGADGAFAPMLKNVIEKALQAEMDVHLDPEQRSVAISVRQLFYYTGRL